MDQLLTRFAQTRFRLAAKRAALAGIATLLIACNPLAAFEPVIVDESEVFAIKAHDVATSTTGTTTYDWTNPQTQATVHHATITRGAGFASIRITDAAGTLVYSSGLESELMQPTLKGVPGAWRIVVTMTGYTGTLGFHVLAGAP
jgi:hypothetical protein